MFASDLCLISLAIRLSNRPHGRRLTSSSSSSLYNRLTNKSFYSPFWFSYSSKTSLFIRRQSIKVGLFAFRMPRLMHALVTLGRLPVARRGGFWVGTPISSILCSAIFRFCRLDMAAASVVRVSVVGREGLRLRRRRGFCRCAWRRLFVSLWPNLVCLIFVCRISSGFVCLPVRLLVCLHAPMF